MQQYILLFSVEYIHVITHTHTYESYDIVICTWLISFKFKLLRFMDEMHSNYINYIITIINGSLCMIPIHIITITYFL